jgi:hypothetical protein
MATKQFVQEQNRAMVQAIRDMEDGPERDEAVQAYALLCRRLGIPNDLEEEDDQGR